MNVLNPTSEATVLPTLFTEPVALRHGDLFHHMMAGGGGYGSPFERDPELVLQDVIQGLVTIDGARAQYGVAIHQQSLTIDIGETQRLRSAP